ncbi:GNAT family N-acetyltransferase [Chelativorans sp. ZYF759]|uniref:GNAT family N-acetyltransferase n=1 Tax=Chelativorans sp. ZYF759 TaxID=2692213 RepID=UPI001FF07C90|nr:GNAT family N-acetyltransferase [Chelativorans sp. ZYF759]
MSLEAGPGAASELPVVRRFEAAGFRAWPAASTHYDGTWAIRLTAGLASRRLNSINPLDPGDDGNLMERMARAKRRFEAYGRPQTFRLSPLAGPMLQSLLDEAGWSRLSESLVMRLDLGEDALAEALPQIPLKDMGRFITAAIGIGSLAPASRPGLSELISSIQPEAGLFVVEHRGQPVSTAVCVHDGSLAGLFEIATAGTMRGQGFGRRAILSALKWAHSRGARQGWLQVEADNEPAIGLYRALGFKELYRYHYRQPSGGGA